MGLTKEERKKRRQERRSARKANRQNRRDKLQALIQMADGIHLPDDDQVVDAVADFKKYWPFLKAGLQFAESLRITGDKLDNRLQAIVTKGDSLADDPDLATKINELVTTAEGYWVKTRSILIIATRLTGDKTDEVIDKVIAIGDEFFNYEG